jgi:RecJ-like exonuclease
VNDNEHWQWTDMLPADISSPVALERNGRRYTWRKVVCPQCMGYGYVDGQKVCPKCLGTKEVEE